MQIKSVLVVFCAVALALASANFRVFEKRAVAIVPGYSLLCLTAGLCGNNYNTYRSFHANRRYGPYYHNDFIPRHRTSHHHHHVHHGYNFGK
ncbi:hypothetical protein L596_003849 [Steinernema carpocapsae]|uniref:Uncharacterized protein n=1 Tax=Steinernema carpocapsae TaxID=34508 RepID=A0A4U8UTR5_STECR|nr:hypothetical protein L596_003849 [Steinernema carpocapsae]